MNNFDYKNLTPFKWFVLENFPFIENDFDAINNYHLFSKVVEYLNKTIDNMNLTGEQMENVTNAMTELQNYVNNLDITEEVIKKLNEMIEDGTLIEIISEISNLINEVSPQKFGAFGDGVHDDTIPFQNCIDFVENLVILNNKIGIKQPSILLFGNYKITDTIFFSPYLSYEFRGDPCIICEVENKPSIHLKYRNNITNENINNNSTSWTRGDIFTGDCLHILNNISKENTCGLEINNSENPNNNFFAFARGSLKNITVTGFDIGVKLNAFHCYIFNFKDLVLYNNNIDFKVGNEGQTNVDFGENISFNNCLFGTSEYGFKNNISNAQFTFYSCSFDFNTKGAIYLNNQTNINMYSGWIEGCRNDDSDLSGIIATPNNNIYCNVNLHDVRFIQSYDNVQLIFGKNITATINNIQESYVSAHVTDEQMRKASAFYISENSIIPLNSSRDNFKMTSPKNNCFIDSLEDETINNPIVSGGTTNFVKYGSKDANTTMIIASDNEEKCISISASEPNLFNGTFYVNELIPIENLNKRITTSFLYKMQNGSVKPVIVAKFFDKDKVSLGISKNWIGSTEQNLLKPNGYWRKQFTLPYFDDIPKKAKYVRFDYQFQALEYCNEILIKKLHCEVR